MTPQFKIGDRVKDWNGEIGTVVRTHTMPETSIPSYQRISVEYDEKGLYYTEGASHQYAGIGQAAKRV